MIKASVIVFTLIFAALSSVTTKASCARQSDNAECSPVLVGGEVPRIDTPEVANRLCCCKTHSGGECCTRVATCGGELIGCFCAFPSVPGARQFSSRPIPLSRAKRTTFVSP